MGNKPYAKQTLKFVGIAAACILVLHAFIVIWAMTEPASIEHRHSQTTSADSTSKARTSLDGNGPTTVASPSFTGGVSTGTVPASYQANAALSWTHVAFVGVLLGSCFALFASLVWAAVALNRDDE